ncbi:MAG: PLP-dependent aminotransferase family protein [Polyangia bacterium]
MNQTTPGLEQLIRRAAHDPRVVSLGGGLPAPELFPRREITAAFHEAMRDPACAALQYDWPEGQGRLRSWVAERLSRRGARITAEDVVITAGAQQGLALATQLLLKAGRIGVEAETYSSALDLFRRRRAELVPLDEPADFLYVVDGVSNPRGQPLDPKLRAQILDSGLPILADEAYAELTFGGGLGAPFLAAARERVWHVGTLSKTLSPGLRVGWLVPPAALRERIVDLKQSVDLQTASLGQVIAENFLERDDFDARLDRARAFYARRADALVSALRRRLPAWRFLHPTGGFSVYVETDQPGDEEAWLRTALAHGVSFDPGSLFRTDRAREPITMRLCFCTSSPSRLAEGVLRLAGAWASFLRSPAVEPRAAAAVASAY